MLTRCADYEFPVDGPAHNYQKNPSRVPTILQVVLPV
jgi:hypothetical protein